MPFSLSRFYLLLCALSVVVLPAFCLRFDDDFVKRLVEQFRSYNQQQPVEKAYVHTDRDAYLTGETIWMKGYIVSGNSHDIDTISKVLYIDLIDIKTKHVNAHLQVRATAGYAPGQLTLADSLLSGTYELRAYTGYMRNFSESYFFTKTLTIIHAQETASNNQKLNNEIAKPDLQFLPEGGQLVDGIEGRVAFKAIDALGRGTNVAGFILDSKKDTVIGFSSIHLGMGFFTLKPEAGQTYTAFVRSGNGSLASYAIPVAISQGISMQVDNLSNKEYIRVYLRNNKTSADAAATLTLVAQTRGQISQVAKIPLSKKTGVVQLSKAEFPEGITQLTLFDETNKPVCERLAFIDKGERIAVTITPTKSAYKNREKVELAISTTDKQGKPVPANLSLAAVDSRLSPEADSNGATIVSHLLLSSDLTGTIEQPGYYFDSAHKDRLQKLDLLLMTQGWRRFAWDDVLMGKLPPITFPVEQGLSLTGRVTRSNQKGTGGKVKLTFLLARRDSTRDFLMGESDEQGNYAAYDLNFTDTATVLIQGVKGKANRDLVITLDQLLTPKVTIIQAPYNPFVFRQNELDEFIKRTNEYLEIERQIRRNREVLLQAVTVKAKKIQPQDARKIYGVPDASVKFDQMNTSGRITILDVIQGRIAGVQVTGSGFNARVQIRGAANFNGPVEPLFVVDGMPMDLQGVMSISVQDVEQVDVLKGASASIYGSRAGGGVISVLTKRGSPNYDLTKETPPGSLVAKLAGYTPIREFYAPRYEGKRTDDRGVLDQRPDYRTTMFWAPLIQTDSAGKATVSFFTSDAKTDIRIKTEGMTTSGLPGVGRQKVHVQ